MKKLYILMEMEKRGDAYGEEVFTSKAKAIKALHAAERRRKKILGDYYHTSEHQDAESVDYYYIQRDYQATKEDEDQDELDEQAIRDDELGLVA